MTKNPKGTHGCSFWKGIFSGWDFFLVWVPEFVSGMMFSVGMSLLRPGSICSLLSLPLGSCLSISTVGEGRIWKLTFIRDFNDWEVEEVLEFFNFIHSKIPVGLDPDSMRWKLCQHGNFDVKSFYHTLDVKSEIVFPWRAIWKVKAPRRVSFFIWSVTWGRILVIIRCIVDIPWLGDVVCVAMTGRQETIF